jgi:uncharacterized membrane protein
MSFSEFCKKNLMSYFIIVTGITVAIAVLGLNLDPDARFGYEAFFSPVMYGALSVLPSFILFSRKEPSFRQMLVRRILHFFLLELIIVGFGYSVGLMKDANTLLSMAAAVFAVYLFTFLLQYVIDSKTAGKINEGLKRLQS